LFLASFLSSVCPAAEAIVDHYIALQSGVLPEEAPDIVMNYNTLRSKARNHAPQSVWDANEHTAFLVLFAKQDRNMLAANLERLHT